MTLIGSDSGIGLFGSNSIVLQNLPDYALIELGFINPLEAIDKTIYNPNKDLPKTAGGITILQKSQAIKYSLFRFQVCKLFINLSVLHQIPYTMIWFKICI